MTSYGSGTPPWGKGQSGGDQPPGQQDGKGYQGSYQQGSGAGAGSYQPPNVSGTYAEQQTQVMEDTMKTHYQAEGTAATVLSQMTTQRYQLQGAHDNVSGMRDTTEKAKQELSELAAKVKAKKRRLQLIAVGLGVVDLLLFIRIAQCGGSFFCKSS